jgi:hypothetical protein
MAGLGHARIGEERHQRQAGRIERGQVLHRRGSCEFAAERPVAEREVPHIGLARREREADELRAARGAGVGFGVERDQRCVMKRRHNAGKEAGVIDDGDGVRARGG